MATPPRRAPVRPSYALYKPLPHGEFLVRRTTDGETFVARPLHRQHPDPDNPNTTAPTTSPAHAKSAELIRRGAARPAANLLNHENLVSVHDELVTVPSSRPVPKLAPSLPSLPFSSSSSSLPGADTAGSAEVEAAGTEVETSRMLLWDWCDAGTLQGVFDEYESQVGSGGAGIAGVGEEGFLPESFVWHIGLGLLRALQWLHEGVRDTYEAVPTARGKDDGYGGGGSGARGGKGWRRVRGTTEAEAGWMPVLHRDLRAVNVLLQHPRGEETYGAVKLGNFARAYVAGSGSRSRDTPVVAMELEDDVPIRTLRERLWQWKRDGLLVYKSQRPYTQGSELFAVGALLYRMMVGRPLQPAEECVDCGCFHLTSDDVDDHEPCDHDCVADVNIDQVLEPLTSYTTPLKHLVMLLLRLNRNDQWWASAVLDVAWAGFQNWTATTEDGRMYRDTFDDIWIRKQKLARLKKRQREMEEEEDDTMEVETDVLVV